MPPRLHVDLPLHPDAELALPPGSARHVQVLRLQPGAALSLFDGSGGEFDAEVTAMGRSEVRVRVGAHRAVDRELPLAVTLAFGMPANERMDTLVEKATELGVATIVPLVCERSVLRLGGERAEKKLAHWRGVATAACEQSGRAVLPVFGPVLTLPAWLQSLPPPDAGARWLLSLGEAMPLAAAIAALGARPASLSVLSGPEGGLSPAEEALARRCGFAPVGLGPRTLRADTAPLAVMAALGLAAP